MPYNKTLYTSSNGAIDAGIIYDDTATKMQDEINAEVALDISGINSDISGINSDITDITNKKATITVPYAAWTGSGPYTQTVTISGATITANTKVDIQPNASVLEQMLADGVLAMFIENSSGVLTLKAFGGATTANVTLQVTYYETA